MLPKTLKYGSKTEPAQARSYTSNIQPQGSTSGYEPNNVITINVPTRQNLVLCTAESVLKFSVKMSGVGSGRLDACGAHAFIQRIRVFSGSNLLEDIDNYGMLAKELFDLQVPAGSIQGKNAIMCGTSSQTVVENGFNYLLTTAATTEGQAQTLVNTIRSYLINPEKKVNVMNNGELLQTGVDRTFCLPLVSIMGTLSSANYFPLMGCTSSPIRLEIQLVDSVHKAVCTTSMTGFVVNNVEYIGSYIELSDNATRMVVSNLTNSLQYSLPSFRNFQYSYNLPGSTTTQINFPIPAKYVSLKSLIVSMRQVDQGVSTAGYYPYSSHHFGLQNYYFRVGSLTMPAIAPSSTAQFFAEVIKTVGSISSMENNPSIDMPSYNMTLPSVNTVENIEQADINSGSFYLGLDLENFQGSDKSQSYSGYNSSNDDIYCVMNFKNPSTLGITVRFDAFANFDQECVFENQTAYVKF